MLYIGIRICEEAERQKRGKNICARPRLEGHRDTKNNSCLSNCFLKFNCCSLTDLCFFVVVVLIFLLCLFVFPLKVVTEDSSLRKCEICRESLATIENYQKCGVTIPRTYIVENTFNEFVNKVQKLNITTLSFF